MDGVVVAGLLLVVLPKRRRWTPLMCAVLLAGSMLLNGCGSGGVLSEVKGGETNPPVVNAPAGVYQVVVTGTGTDAAGNVVTRNAVLSVTVS